MFKKAEVALIDIHSYWDELKKVVDPDQALYCRNLQDRILWLDDGIDWETCSFIAKYIQYLNKNEPDNITPIRLYIFSPGGDLAAMFSLYNIIKASYIPVYTYNMGACHSAAFIIFLAGVRRFMLPDATFIAHEGSAQVAGNYRETKAMLERYKIEVKKMAAIIAENSDFSEEEIERKYDQETDWHICYDLAKERGIITDDWNIME